MKSLEKSLLTSEELLNKNDYDACVRECGVIFEQGLRDVLKQLHDNLENIQDKKSIISAEEKIGKGKAFSRFGLGQLVGLYREADIWSMLRKELTSKVAKVKYIDWNQVTQWRNDTVHSKKAIEIDENDARQMHIWLKTFLYDCELAGKHKVVEKINADGEHLSDCPSCKQKLKKDWQYCPMCGLGVNVSCPNCERRIESNWKICPYCESKISFEGSKEEQLAQKEYTILCRGAWLDGVVNSQERKILEGKRLELGLSDEEATTIERNFIPPNLAQYEEAIKEVLVDNQISEQERKFLDFRAEMLGLSKEVIQDIEKSFNIT